MTTKLLRQVHEQDQQELADRYNGDSKRQPKNVWAIDAMKPSLNEEEYEAAARAVRECILSFPGAKANYDRVDIAWSDAGMARQVDAGHYLWGVCQAVKRRCANPDEARRSEDMIEWLVQLWTLSEIAGALGLFRFTGSPQRVVPDTRPLTPVIRKLLAKMADYYACCDMGTETWKGRVDDLEQISPDRRSC